MSHKELIDKIDTVFELVGKKNDWIYNSYITLRDLNQLDHFHIYEMNWFEGASEILNLIDTLHTEMTPKEDFIYMAKMLNISINPNNPKKVIAAQVKKFDAWKAKSFELEHIRRIENRKKQMKPLYQKLSELGYMTELLPRQIQYKTWVVDAINPYGQIERLYLNEGRTGKVIVQSDEQAHIGILENVNHVLCESIKLI